MSIVNGEIGHEGALVSVTIQVHAARLAVLKRNGLPVPQPVVVMAQLDTGASISGCHRGIFQQLGLSDPFDIAEIRTSSTGEDTHAAEVYLCDLTLHGGEIDRTFGTLRVPAHAFGDDEEVRAVIVRDIINQCGFDWNGPARTLAFMF